MQRSASFIPSWAVLYKTVCCVGSDLLTDPTRVDFQTPGFHITARAAFDELSDAQSRTRDDAITFIIVAVANVKIFTFLPIVTHFLSRGVSARFEVKFSAIRKAFRFNAETVIREYPLVVDLIPQKCRIVIAIDQRQLPVALSSVAVFRDAQAHLVSVREVLAIESESALGPCVRRGP